MKTPFEIMMEYGYKHYWDEGRRASLWFKILYEIFWLLIAPITTIKIWIGVYRNKKLYKRLGIASKK